MLNLEYFGMALTHQKYAPGNTATGISVYCTAYREFFLNVAGVDAGSTEPTIGQWIVGAAGGVGRIVSYTLNSGAWGATAVATLRINSWNGTAFVAAENVAKGANADHFTASNPLVFNPCPTGYMWNGMEAKAALILVLASTALCDWSGAIPDQTSLIGIPLTVNSSIVLRDTNDIKQFKAIDYTAGSASTLQVKLYF